MPKLRFAADDGGKRCVCERPEASQTKWNVGTSYSCYANYRRTGTGRGVERKSCLGCYPCTAEWSVAPAEAEALSGSGKDQLEVTQDAGSECVY